MFGRIQERSWKDPEELWRNIKTAIVKSADIHIPKLGKRKKTLWAKIEIADKRRQCKAGGESRPCIQKLNGEFQRQARRD